MMTVHEVSILTGVSVRALHHYDAIGLLKPARTTEAGYRLYDDASLARLQEILLLRELEFGLKEIKAVIDGPGFDRSAALSDQLALLILKRERLDRLIELARSLLEKGENMDFTAFDDSKERTYAEEARRRWGGTAEYEEFEAKKPGREAADGLMEKFAELGKLKALSPADPRVRAAVEGLRAYISENFYECSPEVFSGLGEMYASDPRFRESIDKAGGEGTAEFVSKAIARANRNRNSVTISASAEELCSEDGCEEPGS